MLTTGQLSAFLKSGQAKAAPSERTAQEGASAVNRIQDAIMGTMRGEAVTQTILKEIHAEIVQQGSTVDCFTLLTTAFLPLNFCASVFNLLSEI